MAGVSLSDTVKSIAKTLDELADSIDRTFSATCSNMSINIDIPRDGSIPSICISSDMLPKHYIDILTKGIS